MAARGSGPGAALRGPAAPAPRRTQAERSASTRARLVEAAIDALHRLGYASTSTTLVADRAGVSRGAMLHHFPTKADLMRAVVEATYEADLAVYAELQATIEDPQEQFLAIIKAAGHQFQTPGGVAQTELWNATRSDPDLAAMLRPLHARLEARTLRALQGWFVSMTGQDGGAQGEALAFLIVMALRGLSLESALSGSKARADGAVALLQHLARTQIQTVRNGGA